MGSFATDVSRRWPNGMIAFDFAKSIDGHKSTFDILMPVGIGGGNLPGDIEKVQRLLNKVEPSAGGPTTKLAITRKVDGPTIEAIKKFQMNRFGFADGRVDSSGPTLIELTVDEVDTTMAPKGLILNAVHKWNKEVGANVKWHRKLNANTNFVMFQPSQRITSPIGMKRGKQEINFNLPIMITLAAQFGCTITNIFTHEMAHAAGMGHEQQRPDRDQFVRINFDNVAPGRRCDFALPPDPECGADFVVCAGITAYDFSSTMQYFPNQASKLPTLNTVVAIDSSGKEVPKKMGGTDGLSPLDIATLMQAYQR